jgi:diguanylate cyclase (GGDEF)-like protein
MNKQAIVEVLDRNNSFLMTYRLMPGSGKEKEAIYVTMKISRMEDDENFIIIGISDVDEQVKQRMQAERMQEEHIAYSRLNALAGDFLCVYVIDPENDRYREYSSTEGYEMLTLPKEGEDFFEVSRKNAQSVIYEEDLPHFMSVFTKEGVMEEIANSGFFAMNYRLVINNILTHVRLKAVIIEEKKGDRLIVGINDINEYVKQEEEHLMRLTQAQNEADIDALTGIRNRHAFENARNELEKELEDNPQLQFAIVILDVNDLKKVNDVEGHKAGDQYLCNACRIICDIFKHSPVFRVGGDEFVVIVRGRDYLYLEELIYNMNKHNAEASGKGGIVIACGMSRFENDEGVTPVYERADRLMYENKSILKEGR